VDENDTVTRSAQTFVSVSNNDEEDDDEDDHHHHHKPLQAVIFKK
jgi:hypothetical protein